MNVKSIDISIVLGYTLSAIFFAFGVVMVSGLTIPEYIPKEFRITMGVVLLLWGLYRFVLTRMKARQPVGEEE